MSDVNDFEGDLLLDNFILAVDDFECRERY
jgi:hypothetical protein